MVVRRSAVSVIVAIASVMALVVAPLHTPAASAQIVINPNRSYPSPSCTRANGLQACIDGLEDGAGIRLTEVALDEDVLIRKSLTIASADGIRARLGHIRFEDRGPGAAIDARLRGIEVTDGIDSSFEAGPRHRVTITGSRVAATNVAVLMSSLVPISVTIEGNTIRGQVVIGSRLTSGTSTLRAVGNVVRPGPSSPAFHTVQLEAGTIVGDIHNNVIRDASEALRVSITESGVLRADIVGNTIDSVTGVVTMQGDSVADVMTLNVFNNIMSNVSGTAFAPLASTTNFRAGFNDYFRVGRTFPPGTGLSAGGGNLRSNPRYLNRAGGDLRLAASSPLIDKGRACTAGGLAALDAAGRFRWAGTDIDMGAFERGSGAPTGSVVIGGSGRNTLMGTSGRDVLCGLGGNDTLTGRGGPDYLDGGSGNDTLCAKDGTKGNDVVRGGSGRDRGTADSRDRRSSVERSGGC